MVTPWAFCGLYIAGVSHVRFVGWEVTLTSCLLGLVVRLGPSTLGHLFSKHLRPQVRSQTVTLGPASRGATQYIPCLSRTKPQYDTELESVVETPAWKEDPRMLEAHS